METRRSTRWVLTAAMCLAGWLTFTVLANVGLAQKAEDEAPRVAPVRHLMSGINNPNSSAIAALLKEEGPADDKAWEKLAMHASVLNEAGHLLMQHDRCPDKIWADATAQLRQGSAGVYDAARKKDLAEAREAFKTTTAACGACHAAHKDQQPEPKTGRVATVATLMRQINKPHSGKVGQLIKDAGPADERAWEQLLDSASILNEASYALMDDDRCPDDTWKAACEQLRTGSAQIAAAVRTKDLTTIRKSFEQVSGACAKCHETHRKPSA